MKIRIEVNDSNTKKANDIMTDLTSDILDKYPIKDANLTFINNNIAEFLLKV